MKHFLIWIFLFFFAMSGFAQDLNIKGQITDTSGESIIGVNVKVKGKDTGTITDIDGNYHLQAAPNDILVVSYIGFITQEVPVKNRKVVNIRLIEDVKALDEVVVVGYGVQKKAHLTGAIATVTMDDIQDLSDGGLASSLSGMVNGMSVSGGQGRPGENAKIFVRDTNSFGEVGSTAQEPLYVIDGYIYPDDIKVGNTRENLGAQAFNNLDPSVIESISVLKDASSAALYGNKAANGVIMITTKKGKSHKLNFRIGVKQGMYTRGIPEYEKLGVNQWMEAMRSGMQSYWEKDAGVTPEDAFEYSKSVNDDIVFSSIFDKNGADMFDENGKFVAKLIKSTLARLT